MADKLLSVQILRKVVGELAQDDGYSQGRVETFFRALDGIPAAIDTDRLQEQLDMLQAYLDTGYTPDQIRDMAFLYREKCQEVSRLRSELQVLKERDTAIAPVKDLESGVRYTDNYVCPHCGKHFTGTYVPLEDIECENSDERNNNHD